MQLHISFLRMTSTMTLSRDLSWLLSRPTDYDPYDGDQCDQQLFQE